MKRRLLAFVGLWLASAVLLTAAGGAPQDPVAPPRAPGAKATFVRPGDGKSTPAHARARLLSLAVERGETPSPFLEPGLFRATYETVLALPARERVRFRVDGRGSVALHVNGERVLDGTLRAGKPLETAAEVRLKKGDNELRLVFESQAMGDGQFRLQWSGAGFGFEPIPPERLSFAADDKDLAQAQLLQQGQHLFAERRCARCHDYALSPRIGESAFGELDQSVPDLRTVGARVHVPWLAAWLREPHSIRPDATMPEFELTDAECDDVAAWLGSLGTPPRAPTFAAEDAPKGRVLFRQLGCVACHQFGEAPAAEPALAARIALAHVPQKWHAAALVAYLRDPRTYHRDVRMPDLRISASEAQQLAAFLLAGTSAVLPQSRGDAERGRRVAQQQRCGICHELDLPLDDRPFRRLQNLNPARGCLAEKPHDHDAPDPRLSDEQRAALRAFLAHATTAPFRRSPLDYAQRHLQAQRCTACHGFDGVPSTWARWAALAGATEPLPKEQDPVAQGVPALTWVGAKLQPSWLLRFVAGEQASPRPWLMARMPAFPRHGGPIVTGLLRAHGYGDKDEPPGASDVQTARHGERLVQAGTGFGCVLCHALGDKPATQVFEREGIELLTARGRLRHEYYTRWLLDPPRLDPDARMTKYADDKGHTAITDVLDGDASKQFEAIWQYLGSRREERR